MKTSNKGDIPIPYIIALVLGIIVIALVAYWLFFSGGEFGNIIVEKSCEAKKMDYCSKYKIAGSAMETFLEKAPECSHLPWASKPAAELCA